MSNDRVLIAGAGPVGLVAAACLVRQDIPVTVLEAGAALATESRASTFHPPTLDMLDDLGAAELLIKEGLIAPKLQYRTKHDGVLGTFDFGGISDLTRHPFRVQSEQFKLTRILYDLLRDEPNFAIEFGARISGVKQDATGVRVAVEREGGAHDTRHGAWLIGADGARSEVRRALGIEFEGFTWPDRFLVLSTPFDFETVLPDLVSVSYVADPERWHFLLRIPGMWRVMFPIPEGVSDEAATMPDYAQMLLGEVAGPRRFEVLHTTLYRVHQRVAQTFRLGRAFLAGDAAHINNPLGGMGMNGGIHDAVNVASRIAAVLRGEAFDADLDLYDRQRRLVTLEAVQKQTIQNKRDLEAADEATRTEFRDRLRRTAADPELTRAFLRRVSMISSLQRAAEIA